MKQKSVMTHQFSQVPAAEIPRSSFDRSHGLKTTFDAGYLIPIFVDEALPGDTFNLNMTGFARLATPIFPVMDNMFMETFFFAVPIRLIWDNWQKFNGEQRSPADLTDFLIPRLGNNAAGFGDSTLEDYFGLPIDVVNVNPNVLWHRAYNLIWHEWFRDQNLQNAPALHKDDGADSPSSYTLLRRGKRHDYFTSCLPWPQKGDSVNLPLGTTAPVVAIDDDSQPLFANIAQNAEAHIEEGVALNVELAGSLDGQNQILRWSNQGEQVVGLMADLTNATASTINQLRQAFQIQKLQERDARGGTRYTEIIRAHFGVTSPDARLQRPEYLGGGSSPVGITAVPQTSETLVDSTSPQGNLAAFGTASLNNHGFTKSFTEHCVILGLISVRADLTYQQGLNRMFSRQTRFDFYWPALSHIGEQAVLNQEIFMGADDAINTGTFGYQERYAEYRYKPSQITGKFRSDASEPLDSWHLSQDFETLPALNATFIQDNPPIDRIIAVTDEPHFLFDAYFSLRCARPMPLYGVPGMIDHF